MTALDDLLANLHTASVTDPGVLVREVRMRIGVLSHFVTVRVYYTGKGVEPYAFETSAYIKTARDRESRPSERTAASEADALRKAVRMLTEEYEVAVRNGQLPEDSWLIERDRR